MKAYRTIIDTTGRTSLLLAGVLLAGIVLRIYDLRTESLWLDEGISIFRAQLSPAEMIGRLSLSTHQPLYYLLLHYWIGMFGDSAISVRLLSSVFGIVSVFMLYKVAAEIFNKDVGLLSALIMAVSVFHIWYSQEARNYSLMTLLSLISMYYFLKLLQKVDLRNSVGYIIPSCLLIYTHYFGFFVIMAQNLSLFITWLIFKERNNKLFRNWILLQGVLAVSYLPWLATLKVQASLWQKGLTMDWIPVPSLYSVYESFETYAGSRVLLLFFVALSIFSVIRYEGSSSICEHGKRCGWTIHGKDIKQSSFLGVWLWVPVLLPFLLSFLLKPMYVTRFTIPASLAFYILVAKGIQNIPRRFFKAVIIILLIGFSSVSIWEYYGRVDKQQWREVAGHIDSNAKKGDVIMFIPGDPERLIFAYYSRREDLKRKQIPRIEGYDKENFAEHVHALTEGGERVWLVVSLRKDPQGIVKDVLKSLGYNIMYHEKYDGNGSLPDWNIVDIFFFEKNRRD